MTGVPCRQGEFKELEATGNKTSPETQEYDSTDAESSVPCPDRIPLNEDQRGLAVRYMPMAHHLAQRLCAIWKAESEELESTAYLRIGGRLGIEPDQPLEAGTDEAEAVDEWLRRLPKAHAAVCHFIYKGCKSEDEVATELGCSRSMLARLHREAVTGLIRAYHRARLAHPQE